MTTPTPVSTPETTKVETVSNILFDKTEKPAAETPKVEAKPEGDKPAEADKKPEGEKPAEGKEIVYDLKLPEGSILDAARIAEVTSFAKEKGLTNEQAQVILDREADAVAKFTESQQQKYDAQVSGWLNASKADKEIGGEALAQSVQFAKDALSKFGSKEFSAILEETGYGNHPEVLRVLARIGRAMGDDIAVKPGAAPQNTKRPEDIMYPSTN